jgi:hypothetical protein
MNELRPVVDETPKAPPHKFRPGPTRPDLTIEQILAWADAFKERFARWPTATDKGAGLPDTTWSAVNACLKSGYRGLPPGSSLPELLFKHRGKRHLGHVPQLTTSQILAWADAHHTDTGEWPHRDTGPVVAAPGETWRGLESALVQGIRGLPGGSSLPQLLASQRGVRSLGGLPPFRLEQILGWADAHHARTGGWPSATSGPVREAPGETWRAVDSALSSGGRGLAGGSSLARFLGARRGVRNPAALPRLEYWEILVWVDAHQDRTGTWPTRDSGSIPEAPGETWRAVDCALTVGVRGLAGGDSLARLLFRRRGKGHIVALPPLSTEQILAWADAHHTRTGGWPTRDSGVIAELPAETWSAVETALERGTRGLPGGDSLPQLLEAERGVRNRAALPPLTPEQIFTWAQAYHSRTGKWPLAKNGPIPEAPGETWAAVRLALQRGSRGLPEGDSLAGLIAKHCKRRNNPAQPPLTVEQILDWADAHRARAGKWPAVTSGPNPEATGEAWKVVDNALRRGWRGLPGGDTLARLLARHRGKRNRTALPALSVEHIRQWIRAHHQQTGNWPRATDGPIPDTGGETWMAVDTPLKSGGRGLPGGSSLAQLVRECRRAST